MKKRVYVKPVDNSLFNDYWVVVEMTWWESFRDDIRRAGWRIAVHNLWAWYRAENSTRAE